MTMADDAQPWQTTHDHGGQSMIMVDNARPRWMMHENDGAWSMVGHDDTWSTVGHDDAWSTVGRSMDCATIDPHVEYK
jgi:hypothetical protein